MLSHMAILLDGVQAQTALQAKLRARIAASLRKPHLAILQVGEREASTAYIARKKKFAETIGVAVTHLSFPEEVAEAELLTRIAELNADDAVTGILVQLPLPEHLNPARILSTVALAKDVDGLATGSSFTPATARGVLLLLEFYRIPIRGKKIAVLGRSALVGTPTAEALRKAGAEVVVCHSTTENTRKVTQASDIIVVAIGKPKLIGADYFRDDRTQVVVDIGINAVTEKGTELLDEEIPKKRLVGDVNFEEVKDRVAAISPVPGGVGPMTVAALFENLVDI